MYRACAWVLWRATARRITVSYTHLDVYKRQAQQSGREIGLGAVVAPGRGQHQRHTRFFAGGQRWDGRSQDVYKRQAAGYLCIMLSGLFIPRAMWALKFTMLTVSNLFAVLGQTLVYLIMIICIANTVEYNEWKTGRREEGIRCV